MAPMQNYLQCHAWPPLCQCCRRELVSSLTLTVCSVLGDCPRHRGTKHSMHNFALDGPSGGRGLILRGDHFIQAHQIVSVQGPSSLRHHMLVGYHHCHVRTLVVPALQRKASVEQRQIQRGVGGLWVPKNLPPLEVQYMQAKGQQESSILPFYSTYTSGCLYKRYKRYT